ncbi:MAG: hypothetical protein K0R67_2586 [Paenibacillus sp.]|nr:hypothetical protein [Paenibacillus sp.]
MMERRVLYYWLQGLFEIMLGVPILLIIYVYLPNGLPLLLWLVALSLIYTISAVGRRAWHKASKWQLYSAAAAAGLLFGGATAGFSFTAFIQACVCFATIMRAFLFVRTEFNPAPKMNMYSFPMTAYFAASLLFPAVQSLSSYAFWINVSGIVSLILVVLKSNREMLDRENHNRIRNTLTKLTLWKNRLFTCLFLAVIFVLGYVPLPYNDGAVGQAMSRFIWWLMYWLNPAPEPYTPPEPTSLVTKPPIRIQDYLPTGETAVWARNSVELLSFIFLSAVLGGMIWLTVWLIRHRTRLLLQVRSWLADTFGRESLSGAGYVDEQRRLLDWKEWSRERFVQLGRLGGRLIREPGWREMGDNSQRVRRAYYRWVTRLQPTPEPHKTPREIAERVSTQRPLIQEEKELVKLYEEVRYGGRKLTDDEIQALRRLYEQK